MTDTSAASPENEQTSVTRRGRPMTSSRKLMHLAWLAFATIIPNYMIWGSIDGREDREETVREEFTKSWGPKQEVYSPILVVPYRAPSDGRRQYLKIAPDRFDLVTDIAPQERRRGLFHATVYDATLDMQGRFVIPGEARLRDFIAEKNGVFLWQETFIAFGTKEGFAGSRSNDHITINSVERPWFACPTCRGAELILARVQPETNGTVGEAISFKSTINMRGTSRLRVLHGGKELDATFHSPWRSPSFIDALPVSYKVTPEGFEAKWQTGEFGLPRMSMSESVIDQQMWNGTSIGVNLIEATPVYRMINRIAKYGLLFVALSFAAYFFFETLSGVQIHIVQYGMLGLSMTLFALLLLSLAELIGYTPAYIASAGLVLAQSSLYTASVTKRTRPALVFAGMLAALFGFFYVVLSLETYSLLVGALALFVVLSVLMILTQRVSWTARPSPAGAGV